jgi:hypothetical protein
VPESGCGSDTRRCCAPKRIIGLRLYIMTSALTTGLHELNRRGRCGMPAVTGFAGVRAVLETEPPAFGRRIRHAVCLRVPSLEEPDTRYSILLLRKSDTRFGRGSFATLDVHQEYHPRRCGFATPRPVSEVRPVSNAHTGRLVLQSGCGMISVRKRSRKKFSFGFRVFQACILRVI